MQVNNPQNVTNEHNIQCTTIQQKTHNEMGIKCRPKKNMLNSRI